MKNEFLFCAENSLSEIQLDKCVHPCFGASQSEYARIHLPVAPICNIQCGYCSRKYDCANDNRPGVTSKILTPAEALEQYRFFRKQYRLSVVGIAGPGDSLANWDTVEQVLSLLKQENPNLIFCLSTNGLLAAELANDIYKANVRYVTITLNALDTDVSAQIYTKVEYENRLLVGKQAAEFLLIQQLKGLQRFHSLGMHIKINTVVIPGINEGEIVKIAKVANKLGAERINLIPMIPVQGTPLAFRGTPSLATMLRLKKEASEFLPVMSHCQMCRADSVGYLI